MTANPGYHVSVVTPPAALAVSLAEAKTHLRVLHASEDALIERYIKAAIAMVENKTGRSLITRTLAVSYDTMPGRTPLVLPRPPVAAVTAFAYIDANGAEQTISPSALRLVPSWAGCSVLPVSGDWPKTDGTPRGITITYTAGYGATAAAIDEDLRAAVFLTIEHLYYHRSAVSEGGLVATPMGVDALLAPFMTAGWI